VLKCKSISAVIFTLLAASPCSVFSEPVGEDIVGGSGSISQSSLNTTIYQSSQNLAINWQSFNINSNERVQFIQPNTSSIALNRILGNNGSDQW